MEYLSKFPSRLKELMEERELKSEELSQTLGIAGSAIRAWLRGEKLPCLENAVCLADFFVCSLDFLAGRKDGFEEVAARPLPAFYGRLRELMKERGIKRYDLTRDATVNDSRISRWAKGEAPSLPSLCVLADRLNVSLDYLVGRTDY